MNEDEKSISLIDIVVFVAENWLLIFMAPLVAAIIFYAWQNSSPRVYVAELDAVVPQEIRNAHPAGTEGYRPLTGVYPPPFVGMEGVRTSLTSRGFLVRAEANSSSEARSRAERAYQATIAPMIEALEAERQNAGAILATTDSVLAGIESDLAAGDIENVMALVELEVALAPIEARIHSAETMIAALENVPIADITQRGMSPALVSALGGLAAASVVVIALAIRQRWRSVAATDDGQLKLRRIKDAFALRHLRH